MTSDRPVEVPDLRALVDVLEKLTEVAARVDPAVSLEIRRRLAEFERLALSSVGLGTVKMEPRNEDSIRGDQSA